MAASTVSMIGIWEWNWKLVFSIDDLYHKHVNCVCYEYVCVLAVTDGLHQMVPDDMREEAIAFAKEALKEPDSEDDD